MGVLQRSAAVVAVTVGLVVPLTTVVADASTRYAAGSVGHDVSYPQCNPNDSTDDATPPTGSFGLIGIDDGKPWVHNACAGAEWTAATGLSDPPELYLNTANPAPKSSYYWPKSGASDPKRCKNATSTTDPGCAYDYGWHAAADSLAAATSDGITTAASSAWWLDVETDNTWNGNGASNAADIQGAVDYLRQAGAPTVGIYTSASDWTAITGGYDKGNGASYAKVWKPEFTAAHPLSGLPVWVLGDGTKSEAKRVCAATSPTGAPTWLGQFNDGTGVDADLACAPVTAPSFTVRAQPSTVHIDQAGRAKDSLQIKEKGPAQRVSLTISGLPKHVTVSWSTRSVDTTKAVRLTVKATDKASRGSHQLTITELGVTARRTTRIKLVIR